MQASVIISTYNSPLWLERVLVGYACQSIPDFEIVVADDGSTQETANLINRIRENYQLAINHVWHEDQGFQKTRILNKAVLASKSEYLIFTDGDCIPRHDFVETHLKYKEKAYFLSGGHFPLSMKLSHQIKIDDIKSGRCFNLNWLKANGLSSSFKNIKLTKSSTLAKLMNRITPTKPTWNGGNASAWKKDVLAVNGFDERMQYGGEDREFGERLINLGIQPKRVRYFAIIIHLEHERGYVNQTAWKKNDAIREETKSLKRIKTDFGFNLHESKQNQLIVD
ncbi:glycosyltransferase family 2 protein [Psychroflexus sp. ALD_RP9]|uniref:glycosyltransferase family 2 protein n=1 Tax=Psychroflexus sp. ALD_RP9 TaxID=2777186 RepID=UPI001A9018BA|nr:glycosyltransferase family 2 protein [Psychroflexus sp. ALD_RP9]QSS96845.1 glycosyltransferase family 2 protein [Psychroflexus sp. ALD_RP9]